MQGQRPEELVRMAKMNAGLGGTYLSLKERQMG